MVLAYEAVVEYFYRHMTVIPMRYGYRLSDPHDAATLLRENHEACCRLLDQLEGFEEMGIQVLLDHPRLGAGTHRLVVQPEWFPSRSNVSGAANLEPKESRHRGTEQAFTFQNELVEDLCDSLRGSYVRHKVEFPFSNKSRRLYLYFLAPRDSVQLFCQTAHDLPANRSVKMLLGGPWPPYDFVDVLQT
jgi:hypothetical protein